MNLTAIVPVYNVERYLEDCIDSLISQTEKFDEIILVNDGSTDKSQEICEKYCSQYPYITLFTQQNQGLSAARNAGLEKAAGDYVIFVDSDDYVSRETVKKLKESLCRYQTDLLYYNATFQYEVQTYEKPMLHAEEFDFHVMKGREFLYASFPDSYSSSACLAAFKTDFLNKYHIRFPEGVYFEDNLFSLQAALRAESICCIPDNLYIRRCRADSIMTGRISEEKCRDTVWVQRSMWECLKENGIDRENAEFTGRFVSAGLLYGMGYLSQSGEESVQREWMKRFLYHFFEMWLTFFSVERRFFGQSAAMLAAFQEIQELSGKEQADLIDTFWDSRRGYLLMGREFVSRLRKEVFRKLKRLPLNQPARRVGIYGCGRHTVELLRLYVRLVGKIQSDLYFIVTEKKEKEFQSRPVITVAECKNIVDTVIISSKLYQQEMRENLKKNGVDIQNVIVLYEPGDVCDFITSSRFL
ncbi:MAG: glycosyltransferase [Dorea sp.]|nr:glycosyltransferase [Dorea sp.]